MHLYIVQHCLTIHEFMYVLTKEEEKTPLIPSTRLPHQLHYPNCITISISRSFFADHIYGAHSLLPPSLQCMHVSNNPNSSNLSPHIACYSSTIALIF
jgi:hypothetical protein